MVCLISRLRAAPALIVVEDCGTPKPFTGRKQHMAKKCLEVMYLTLSYAVRTWCFRAVRIDVERKG